MSLSRQEQETIILFNEAEDTATVDTCNPALIRKLDKLITCRENTMITLIREDAHGKAYVIPKKWVKVSQPPMLTEEQRAKKRATAIAQFGHGQKNAPNAAAGEHEA